MKAKVSYKRHLAKTITWRLVGTVDTMVLAWLITGNPLMGFKIGGVEVVTKMILYYLHERLWYKINFRNVNDETSFQISKKRHVAKTIMWRAIGTLDTMTIAWIISGNPMMGVKVGGAEVVTKMVLYYFHERVWYRIKFGIKEE